MNLLSLISVFAIIATLISPINSATAQTCPVDTSGLQHVQFDDVWTAIQVVPNERSEYETTEQFETRQASASHSIAAQYLIEMPLNGRRASYDPDTQRLIVPQSAAYPSFLVLPTAANGLFGYDSEFGRWSSSLIGVTARSEHIETGAYRAENAFGVQRSVTQVDRIRRYIFERVDRRGSLLHRRRSPRGDEVWFDLTVPPDEAREIRQGGSWSVLYAPAPPYWAYSEGWPTSPSLSNPVERRDLDHALIGDIQCIFLRNANGDTVASRETQ